MAVSVPDYPLEGLSKANKSATRRVLLSNLGYKLGGSFRRPRISLGSWLSTLQILLRGSCEVFWAMTLRSYLIKTTASDTEVLGLAAVSGIPEQCTTHPT